MTSHQHIREKSLKVSLLKGLFGCLMTGLTQEYFTPFLLFLGASALHIGVLNSAANLCASLVQLVSTELTQKLGSRKKMVGATILLQALILALMTYFAFSQNPHYKIFIILVVAFLSLGSLFHPVWCSFLSDLVDTDKRGEYFGWRNRVLGLLMIAAMGFAGFIIDRMGQINTAYGFTIIFSLALLCRLLSFYFLIKMDEPPLNYEKEHQFSFIQFFSRFRESNFVKFTIFVASMNFAINLAAPYFAVLMLRDLYFDYLTYTTVIVVAPLTLYLTIQRWGQHADQVGNLKVIRLTALLISTLPFLWIINRSPIYLIFVEMFSGFAWAGFSLCTVNFIFDAVTPEKRTRCLAYFSLVNGLALAAGAFVGGLIVKKLPALFGYEILSLFLISSLLRFSVAILGARALKEVRSTKHVKSVDLFFSMIRIRPILGIDRRRMMRI